MKGDFSRLTFDPAKLYLRVLTQQGRVQLDADANEQTAILLYYLQTLAADLIGPFGGPDTVPRRDGIRGGFGIYPNPTDVLNPGEYQLTPGRYYVDGILCENAVTRTSKDPGSDLPLLVHDTTYLLYLDAWEREITYIHDDGIREVALGGPDTCLRTTFAWRVRATDKMPDGSNISIEMEGEVLWQDWSLSWINQWQPNNRGRLQAQVKPATSNETELCTASPDARYRGSENHLYRVEIHQGTEAGKTATFKWSRDNGSVTFAVRRMMSDTVFLENLGKDVRTGLKPGDWVELLDDTMELSGKTGILLQVDATDGPQTSVRLKLPQGVSLDLPEYDEATVAMLHPYLRCWNHKAASPSPGAPTLVAGALAIAVDAWLALEDGVRIRFKSDETYRAGDYWLIPARTAGDVEWPGPMGQPEWRAPHGVEHHYAPLALVNIQGSGKVDITDFRRLFPPQAVPILELTPSA